MKLPRVAQLARALARSETSAVADRYEPEVASEPDPVDGVHPAAGEGEHGSNPAPGTFFTRLAAAFRSSKIRSAYRSPEEQQELERRAQEARRMNTTPVSSAVERRSDRPEVASGAMLAKTVNDPSGGDACSVVRSLGPEAEVARGSNPARGIAVTTTGSSEVERREARVAHAAARPGSSSQPNDEAAGIMSPAAEDKGAGGDEINNPEDGVSKAPPWTRGRNSARQVPPLTDDGLDEHRPRNRPWIAWRQELGDPECPYLIRWLFDPRLFSIRLHHWVRSDDKRAMHDHSWWFLTLVLSGGYTDWIHDLGRASETDRERVIAANKSVARAIKASRSATDGGPGFFKLNPQAMPYTEDRLTRGSVRFRPAHHIHTVAVDPGGCWTLVFTGRFVHKYGFYVRKASGLLKFRKANKYFNQHGHHPCDQL